MLPPHEGGGGQNAEVSEMIKLHLGMGQAFSIISMKRVNR